jgi:hypothetical protein
MWERIQNEYYRIPKPTKTPTKVLRLTAGGSYIFSGDVSSSGTSIPVDFNTDILQKFQQFVKNIMVYNDYMETMGNLVPESIEVAEKNILRFRDGLEFSFVNYIQSLSRSN